MKINVGSIIKQVRNTFEMVNGKGSWEESLKPLIIEDKNFIRYFNNFMKKKGGCKK